MDFRKTLKGLKAAIDKEIERQLDIAIRDAGKKDVLIAQALEQIKKIALAGGKRIRGALLYSAYVGVGGKEKKKILKAAAAIELVHLFLLIHDDIIDRGDLRHGKETLHKMFSKNRRKNVSQKDAEHFGDSMAIIAGDMLHALANKIILEAGFDQKITADALGQLQLIITNTIIGQSQDIAIAYGKDADEAQVLAMYENKTARYTFEGPLHLGVMFAGNKDQRIMKSLSRYALPLGKAFQIQDDILGVFGNEMKMGKSAASDIEEGKKSLMVVRAFKSASVKQKKQLDALLGKKNISKKEIGIFQEILMSVGALGYAQEQVAVYLAQGKEEIMKTVLLAETKKFLVGLIEYLERRDI